MRNAIAVSLAACAALALTCASARADVKLPAIIDSNMVLQRDIPLKIWGWADPGEKVTVSFDKQKLEATADKDGNWLVKLEPTKAGGPFDMIVAGKNTLKLENVLVGEVWVCSGQSNMEFGLSGVVNAKEEVAAATYPKIRLFTVPKLATGERQKDVKGAWAQCTPQSAGRFSAVAYLFARHIFKGLNEEVPVGMIHTSWGGSACAPWMPTEDLLANAELKKMVEDANAAANIKDLPAAMAEYKKKLDAWEKENYPQDPGNKGYDQGWADPKADVSAWKECKVPHANMEEATGIDMDGAMWFRAEVDVPAKWAGKNLVLGAGVIDDFDTTYFNNEKVGATGKEQEGYWQFRRKYPVPGKLVVAGKNTIAVRVWDQYLTGGLLGPAQAMTLSLADNPDKEAAIPLAGAWKYKVELELKPKTRQTPQPAKPTSPDDMGFPGSLYNGMIAPLVNYGIRGVLWYQGETDAGAPFRYRTLFPAMIASWRKAWGQGDFPFLYVQLANFGAGPEWVYLQEAQTMTLATKNVGMAVINDTATDKKNIHPPNKQDVAKRLGLIAMATVYGAKDLEYSGPLYQAMKIDGNKVVLSFTHLGGGLVAKAGKGESASQPEGAAPAELKGFIIAGEDKKFVAAQAKIVGDTVVVWSDTVEKPAAVRYAWDAWPDCNLFNKAGLPASCFRTDDWPSLGSGKD
jgi:sialate O-acetylesterase